MQRACYHAVIEMVSPRDESASNSNGGIDFKDRKVPLENVHDSDDIRKTSATNASDAVISIKDDIEKFLKPSGPDPASLGDRAELHRLCDSCDKVLQKSPLISKHSYSALKLPEVVEVYQLHENLRHLRASVDSRCHFCTLVWQVLKPYLAAKVNESQLQKLLQQAVILEARARQDTSPIDTLCEMEIVCGDIMQEKTRWRRGCAGHRFLDLLVKPTQGFHNWSDWEAKHRRDSIHPAQTYFSTSSDEHMALARYWLEECSSKHALCSSRTESDFIPTRLLDVGATGDEYVSLHCSRVKDRGTRYCTLSHTWGGVKDIVTLSKTNRTALQRGISLSSLPKTFRDAVTVVRALNIQYLWIDSICIIQDSADDWTSEATLMGHVYANSACTIMASAAHGPHEGLFSCRDPLAVYSCKVGGSFEAGSFAAYGSTDTMLLSHSHLQHRGWIVQERILSPRLLNFAIGGISWSCVHGEAMEIERDGMATEIARRSTGSGFYDQRPLQKIFGPSVRHVDWTVGSIADVYNCNLHELEMYTEQYSLDNKLFRERFNRYWRHTVTLYTYCKLTDSDDKLVALSAIAQRLQRASGYTYLAGLWFQTLMFDLLWSASNAALNRQSKYRAPSWSWASVEGSIFFGGAYSDEELGTEPIAHFQSCDCTTHPLDTSKTGKVADAQLRLSTKLRPWTTGVGRYLNGRHELLSLSNADVGYLHSDEGELDHRDPRLEKLYLCPLRKLFHASGEAMRIEGLAVVPHAGGSNHYERLGTFLSKSYRTTAETFLDGYPAQDIVLR
jgi:hypothetical protein